MCIQKHTEIQPGQRSRHHCQPGLDRRLFLVEEEVALARLPIVISADPSRNHSPDNLLQMLFFCYSYLANELRAYELMIDTQKTIEISEIDKIFL